MFKCFEDIIKSIRDMSKSRLLEDIFKCFEDIFKCFEDMSKYLKICLNNLDISKDMSK